MVYSFARIGAAVSMKIEDVYVQNRRLWVACTRKAANAMKCPATAISKPSQPSFLSAPF
jgi:integrase/recombinase XerC